MTSGNTQAGTPGLPGREDKAHAGSVEHGSTLSRKTLRSSVEETLENYFAELDGQTVNDLYELFLSEVEAPLLEAVLKQTGNNQSKTASMLGLNRGTLRKKLKKYGLL
jgi:Fis family transcriptional regulator